MSLINNHQWVNISSSCERCCVNSSIFYYLCKDKTCFIYETNKLLLPKFQKYISTMKKTIQKPVFLSFEICKIAMKMNNTSIMIHLPHWIQKIVSLLKNCFAFWQKKITIHWKSHNSWRCGSSRNCLLLFPFSFFVSNNILDFKINIPRFEIPKLFFHWLRSTCSLVSLWTFSGYSKKYVLQ